MLPGAYALLVFQGPGGNAPLGVAWAWAWLARRLPFAVVGWLVWRLGQQRWGWASVLALPVGAAVLVRFDIVRFQHGG